MSRWFRERRLRTARCGAGLARTLLAWSLCALVSSEALAEIPWGGGEPMTARYVLLQQGKEVGREDAIWSVDPDPGRGVTLESSGGFAIGGMEFTFHQTAEYDGEGVPLGYDFRAVVAGDTQIVRARFTPDSLFMEADAYGRSSRRAHARPMGAALMDNLLTSQTQTVVWNLPREDGLVYHAAVPQRLFLVPATFHWRGDFAAADTSGGDRGQAYPAPVPAEEIEMEMAGVKITLVVSKSDRLILQAAVPQQGVRFELREFARGSDVLYSAAPRKAVAPAGFREEDLLFTTGDLGFIGTMCLPIGLGPFPLALLLQGSGPLDRDETIGPNAPFKDLAHGLALRGIASFRFDKRTYAHPKSIDPATLTLNEEMIHDGERALGKAVSHQQVRADAVFLVGHSLGGTAAPFLRRPVEAGVRGLVLMSAMGRPFSAVLSSQLRYLAELGRNEGRLGPEDEARSDKVLAALDSLRVGILPPERRILGMTAAYIEDIDRRDAPGAAAALGVPILILQGERDYQVTVEDARLLEERFREEGVKDVEARIFPGLGHLFIPVDAAVPEAYQVAGSLSGEVIDAMADWMDARVPR